MTQRFPLPDLRAAVAEAESRRADVARSLESRRLELPIRFWRQEAHYTTPASDLTMSRKAIETGTAPVSKILRRLDIQPAELADRLGVDRADVERLLESPRRAPLVMLDAEDAVALRPEVVQLGLRNAAAVLFDADWFDASGNRALRFFRPPGFNLEGSVRDLYSLIWTLAERAGPEGFPLDGIVFPKIEHPEEVDLLYEVLEQAESSVGLPRGSIRVSLLVESCWSALQLAEISRRGVSRLVSLVFGVADYSADIGMPTIGRGTVIDWARAELVNVASAIGVPAIDAMTLDYPVADPNLDGAGNRHRVLDRMAITFSAAVDAASIGMLGKWVGHPAQLFVVLLAYDRIYAPQVLEIEVSKLASYATMVHAEAKGATIISGVMSDRATDRHARAVLRRATAVGRFDPLRAHSLGVITSAELAELKGAPRDP